MRRLLCLFLFLATTSAFAERIYEGYTVVRGKTFAFQLKAPRGWVLDNEIARSQGLNVVFYPTGADWNTSKVASYVRVRSNDGTQRKIEDQVQDTLRNLHETGSPNAKAEFIKTLTTQDASKAKIYFYSGDKFGNLEATAYIQGKDSINFVTLTARDQDSFRQAMPAFESLVASYEDLTK
jgi:hypothetical protein